MVLLGAGTLVNGITINPGPFSAAGASFVFNGGLAPILGFGFGGFCSATSEGCDVELSFISGLGPT